MCDRLMDWMGSPPKSRGSCQGGWGLTVARGPCIRSSSPLGLPWPDADVSDASASGILPLLVSSRQPRLADCSFQRGESYSRFGVNEKSNHPAHRLLSARLPRSPEYRREGKKCCSPSL